MPRARNLKPSFFANDELAEIEMAGRLLFAGLWTIADREGRLEDRPKRIKGEIFRYDDVDVDRLLTELHAHGFILRYAVNGERFIQVVNFSKHQNPHQNEPASTLPAPEDSGASTVQVPDQHQSDPADSLLLNPSPDSGLLIEDSRESPAKPTRKPKSTARTRAPDVFEPDDELLGWAQSEHGIDARRAKLETQKFLDHHRAVGSLMADWRSAWRKWIGNANNFSPRASPNGTQTDPALAYFKSEAAKGRQT